MVKKLFKHEFISYGQVMALVYGILLIVAVATKLILVFESDTTAYQIIRGFTILLYVVSVLVALGFAFVMAIVRFYRNLFTSEGYLSFTLPVTTSQHIIVKAVTAVCVEWVTMLMVIASACIVLSGEALGLVWKGLGVILDDIYATVGAHAIAFGIELFVMMLLASFTSVMLYYTCISIGQLSRKNRVLAAVGVYFAYYILTQILSTILTILLTVFAASGLMEELGYWIAMHPNASIHLSMCISIVLSAAFLLIEFIVVRSIITKKLNLE